MHKRALFAVLMLAAAFFQLHAGDVALFENLGFSEDSRYFLFGQYGIGSENGRAYAELYAVDVEKNRFLPSGVLQKVYQDRLTPGQTGAGALYMALQEFRPVVERYKFNHLANGRLVYLLMNGEEPQERLEFRDFQRGDRFVVDLIQHQYGTGKDISSSFHLAVAITDKAGATRSFMVGHPDFKRKGVLEYKIKQTFFSPDEKGLVFVIEREELDTVGSNIRYMVETLRW